MTKPIKNKEFCTHCKHKEPNYGCKCFFEGYLMGEEETKWENKKREILKWIKVGFSDLIEKIKEL